MTLIVFDPSSMSVHDVMQTNSLNIVDGVGVV
jgi:hypothetical protein